MNKKIINAFGYVLIAVSFVFLARRFAGMDADWGLLAAPTALILLAVVPILNVAVIFLNAFCWGRALALFASEPVSARDVFAVYAKSNLGKYLPGNVGHYAARQMFAAQLGLRQAHIALASVLEIGYSSCAMLGVSLLFSADMAANLFREKIGDGWPTYLGLAIVAALAACLAAFCAFRGNKRLSELVSLAAKPRFWLTMLGVICLFSMSTAAMGATFAVIMGQYASVGPRDGLLLIGGFTVSCFIGFVTPGVPGGIGVRETAMLLLLAPYFPDDRILLAAAIQRLTMIIGDAAAVPFSRLLNANFKWKRKSRRFRVKKEQQ